MASSLSSLHYASRMRWDYASYLQWSPAVLSSILLILNDCMLLNLTCLLNMTTLNMTTLCDQRFLTLDDVALFIIVNSSDCFTVFD